MSVSALNTAAPLASAPETRVSPAIEKAAQDFETMFLNEMFSHMFSGVDTDPVFGGGKSEKIFRGMMIGEYAKKLTSAGGIGISAEIRKAMIEMQHNMNGGKT